jgi:ribosome maturation factor RimP
MSNSQSRPQNGGRNALAKQRDAVIALLEPAVQAEGLHLEDVDLRAVGRRLVLRILVDSDSGVNLDDVARASQTISTLLDDNDPFDDESYTLEVSSPGVDRPLTLPRHWVRNIGRLVQITLANGTQVTGRVSGIEDDVVSFGIENKGRVSTQQVSLSEISKAVVQIEFSRVETADLQPIVDDSDNEDTDAEDTDADYDDEQEV